MHGNAVAVVFGVYSIELKEKDPDLSNRFKDKVLQLGFNPENQEYIMTEIN